MKIKTTYKNQLKFNIQFSLEKRFLAFSLIVLTFFTSCDNLLDIDKPINQIDSELVFESSQTANAALAGLYSGLFNNSPLSGDTTGALLSYYTDDLNYFYTSTNASGIEDIFLNQQLPNNSPIENYWNNAYQKIYTANAIIEGVQKSTALSHTDKNRIEGEALFIRSLLFYYLEEIFGDIPYPVSTDYKINQSLTKTEKTQVLHKLQQDVSRAVNLLEDTYKHADRIYPNKKTAQLLLAKIYVLQHQWIPAQQLLTSIISSPLYTFQNDLSKVFIKSSPHILWQLKPNNATDPTKEIQVYYFTGAPTLNALSTSLVNEFDATDLRRSNYMTAVTVGSTTWYRANKYKNRTTNTTEYSVIFRLEEVYLLLAEVYARQNKIADALPYLNKTRQRADLTPLPATLTLQQLYTEIANEDRREFFTEMGHRFFDLKRLDMLNTLQTTKPNWKSYHAFWPLPLKELLLNPNLNPQNPGY